MPSQPQHPAPRLGIDQDSVRFFREAKKSEKRFAMVTAYDFTDALILNELDVPVILVGDSVGMVRLGYDSPVPVTLPEMVHHTRAVVRGAPDTLVVADMPFGSYQGGPDQALVSARLLLDEGGAGAVKLEGGRHVGDVVMHLSSAGIPVLGHIGLIPQSVHQLGGFKVQGRGQLAAKTLIEDAVLLVTAGAVAIVIECVPADVGRRVTQQVAVPSIGIGAGPMTDGQVLVLDDMIGMTPGRLPKFVKRYADVRTTIRSAVKTFQDEVRDGTFPETTPPEHEG